MSEKKYCLLIDWGNTVMVDPGDQTGPMVEWKRVKAVPGFAETAGELKETFHLALATNAGDSDSTLIRKALARVHLDGFFSWIFPSCEIGHEKPSTLYFSAVKSALAAYGVLPLAMVGDSFENDVRGAVQAGIFGIWLNLRDEVNRRGAHYLTIRSWPEIIGILPGLELL